MKNLINSLIGWWIDLHDRFDRWMRQQVIVKWKDPRVEGYPEPQFGPSFRNRWEDPQMYLVLHQLAHEKKELKMSLAYFGCRYALNSDEGVDTHFQWWGDNHGYDGELGVVHGVLYYAEVQWPQIDEDGMYD